MISKRDALYALIGLALVTLCLAAFAVAVSKAAVPAPLSLVGGK